LLVRWRVAVLCCAVALAAGLAVALPSLRVGFRVDGFFQSDDPVLQEAMGHYSDAQFDPPDRLLLFGWDEAAPTSPESVARLQRFGELLEGESLVDRVLTLANAKAVGAGARDPAKVAMSATWRHLLVSRKSDAVAGIVVLRPNYGHELLGLFARMRTAATAEGRTLQLCGLPYHNTESRALVRADMARFLPIGTAVSAVLLFWLIPHWLLAALALVVVPLTLTSTLGTMALAGVEVTMLTSTLPTLLLCMSIADGVHLVGRFLEERAHVGEAKAAAAHTFAAMFVPCLMTSLTTIVGFGSLCTARLVDLRWLGLFAAVGMVFAFVYTMAILPAAMSWVRSPVGRRPGDPATLLVRASLWCQRFRPRTWLTVAAVVFAISAVGSTRVTTEHRITADLWPDSPVVQQLRWYEERFVGVVPSEVIVEAPGGFGTRERDQLATLRERLEAEPGVSRTLSIADLLADGLAPLLVPVLAASGLLPAGMISSNGRQARMLVFRGDLGTVAWRRFAASIAGHAADLPDLRVRLAGMQMVGTEQVLRMTSDLVWSFAGSIVLILLLVWLQCRDLWLAGIAMLSCLLPMLAVVALMAATDITLRPLTVIAFCVALGLMIDDAIHMVARWQEERRAGADSKTAVHATITTAGRPVVITTLLLLVGFATILGSEFRGTFLFGFLVVVSLVGAVVAALVPLPALLQVLGARQDTRGPP
jgi:uncharacterized protein